MVFAQGQGGQGGKGGVAAAFPYDDVPVVPLNHPIHDVAMQNSVTGYQFWFHREPDSRQFRRA